MGYLLDVVTPQMVDSQRDVVKNERRQSYENAPYGKAYLRMTELLFPKDHPYYWPVIGYMEDLSAATHEDVTDFFRKYYAPGNASLVVAGDINQRCKGWGASRALEGSSGRARWGRQGDLDRSGAAAAHLPGLAHAGSLQTR
jgi:hypothetical protein